MASQCESVVPCCRCGSREVRNIESMEVVDGCGLAQHVSADIDATNAGTVCCLQWLQ